ISEIYTLYLHDALPILISHENGWYKIKLSTGQVGYIADWLATPSDSNSVSKTAIVQVDHLNIRSADSATSQVLGQLNTNDEIQVDRKSTRLNSSHVSIS